MEVVQLWVADLDRPPLPQAVLESVLSPDERERRDRFVQRIHRDRFGAGRGLLRVALSAATGTPRADLRFEYSDAGKPTLPLSAAPSFNVSHSEQILAIGLIDGDPLGLDVEVVRPVKDRESLARTVFTPGEILDIERASAGERDRLFLTYWTAKEALLKAIGLGLGIEPICVEVRRVPGPGSIFSPRGEGIDDETSGWWIHSFDLADLAQVPPSVLAIALPAPSLRIRMCSWPPPPKR